MKKIAEFTMTHEEFAEVMRKRAEIQRRMPPKTAKDIRMAKKMMEIIEKDLRELTEEDVIGMPEK